MNRKIGLILAFVLGGVLSIIGTACAHGVVIEHKVYVENGIVKIDVHASFDSGEAMSEAQVAIFAPNDLANPWKTGKMDADGNFTFEPDLSISGTWDIQVRKAGHGDMIHVQIKGDEAKTLGAAPRGSGEGAQAPETAPTAAAPSEPAAAVSPAIAISGTASDYSAPLVQIVVNDGSVVVSEGGAAVTPAAHIGAGYSTAQIVVMAVCVIWGFVGTALFFARKGRN